MVTGIVLGSPSQQRGEVGIGLDPPKSSNGQYCWMARRSCNGQKNCSAMDLALQKNQREINAESVKSSTHSLLSDAGRTLKVKCVLLVVAMTPSPKKRTFLIFGALSFMLVSGGAFGYLYSANYFNSCESDLNALIKIYGGDKSISALLSDSSLANKLFANLDSQNCRSKEEFSDLYKSLLSRIRNSMKLKSLNQLNNPPILEAN